MLLTTKLSVKFVMQSTFLTIRAALEKHGFVLEKVCDGESFGPLTEESERYFFCAVKQYTQLEEKENV